MDMSKNGYAFTAAREGLALKPYIDSGGVKTVGLGSTQSDIWDLDRWAWDREITIEKAVEIYKEGMKKYISGVNRALTRLTIPQNQFDALVSITYNIGVGGMTGSTFMKYVNAGRPVKDIVKAVKMWNKDNGKVVQGLVNRRQQECDLFENGIYAGSGFCDLIEVDKNHKPHYNKRIRIIDYL